MTSTPPNEPGPQRIDQVLFGGLAGLSVGVVIQLVDKQPKLTSALGWSLYCFAAGLPILAASFLMEMARPGATKSPGRMLFDLSGVLLALAGFVLLFFFLSLIAGGVFLFCAAVCFVVVVCSLR